MAPLFPLVVVVHADADVRLARLVETARYGRGRRPRPDRRTGDARSSAARSPTCGWTTPGPRASWSRRPANCGTSGSCRSPTTSATADPPRRTRTPWSPADPGWPAQAARIAARLNTACGHRAVRIDHIGSTAVAGMDARDIIDMQITVASLESPTNWPTNLLQAGYPGSGRSPPIPVDDSEPLCAQAFPRLRQIPGRPTHVHIRADGDRISASRCCSWTGSPPTPGFAPDYLRRSNAAVTRARWTRWFVEAHPRAWAWAQAHGLDAATGQLIGGRPRIRPYRAAERPSAPVRDRQTPPDLPAQPDQAIRRGAHGVAQRGAAGQRAVVRDRRAPGRPAG